MAQTLLIEHVVDRIALAELDTIHEFVYYVERGRTHGPFKPIGNGLLMNIHGCTFPVHAISNTAVFFVKGDNSKLFKGE